MRQLLALANFQYLQSTLRFFNEYLKIDLALENKDDLILGQAVRNIVVHNKSEVDSTFLAQIRKTKHSKKYKDKDKILLTEKEYQEFSKDFRDFSEKIISELKKKYK